MHKTDFDEQVERMERVYGSEFNAGLIAELEHQYGNLNPNLWVKVCTHVLQHAKRLPSLAFFHEAHMAVVDKWQRDVEDENKCPECRGTKFTTVYYLAKLKGSHDELPPTPYRGARPCQLCNRDLRPRNTRIEHVRDITEEEYERLTA